MAEQEKPSEQQVPPDWGTTADGRVFIEGVDVTHIVSPGWEPQTEEDKPKADPDNAQVEGEEAEAEPKVEKKEEPKAEPEPEKKAEPKEEAEEGSEEAEAVPEEPPKWKFKTKFRGQEEEKEYTPDQVQVRLNKLRAFEENEREFWERRKQVEPYAQVVQSDWFKAKLKDAYDSGELERPVTPPEPPPLVQWEIQKRKADEDYGEVLSALRSYALSLPEDAVKLIDSNAEVFLAEYDRIANEVRTKRERVPDKPVEPERKKQKLSPEEVKAKLSLKEKAKESAITSKPGQAAEPVSPAKAWQAEEKRLEKEMKNPDNASRQLEIIAQLLMHRQNKPTQ